MARGSVARIAATTRWGEPERWPTRRARPGAPTRPSSSTRSATDEIDRLDEDAEPRRIRRPSRRRGFRRGGRRGRGRPRARRASRAPDAPVPRRRGDRDRARPRWAPSAGRHHRVGRDRLHAARRRSCCGAATTTRPRARPARHGDDRAALLEVLSHFGIEAQLIGTVTGPHVSRYELQLAPGTKVGKIAQLKDDLAYALASTDIRILAPIPGKKAVGVEVPNARRKMVRLGDIYQGRPDGASPLLVLARQGHLRPRGLDGPREDAARPRRRHDRLGQVRLRQRDPHLDAAARLAERAPARPRRPQAGRAQPLRLGPAPADARRHQRRGSPPTCSRT